LDPTWHVPRLDVRGVVGGRDQAGGKHLGKLTLHVSGLRGDVDATATEPVAELEFRGVIGRRDDAGGREL
jgi:hypothetical protein